MPAILQRLFYGADGKQFPQVQNLHRDETLLVETEWCWHPAAEDGAYRFPSLERADAACAAHEWKDATGHVVKPFPVICAGPDMEAVRRHEENRIATALKGNAEASEPVPVPADVVKPRRPRQPRAKKLAEVKTGPPARPSVNRVEQLKEIYRTRVAGRHTSPEESYAELERRHLD